VASSSSSTHGRHARTLSGSPGVLGNEVNAREREVLNDCLPRRDC
jgi:hypothetical protein